MTQNKTSDSNEIIPTIKETWDPSSLIIEPTKNHAKSIINREQLDNSKEVLWKNKVSSRITLLRHFPYNEESSKNKQTIDRYNDILRRIHKNENVDTEELSRLELIVDQMIYSSFDNIPDNKYLEYKNSVKEIFNNPWNTLIIYAETWKKRVKISWDNLREQFKIKDKEAIDLKWSNKSIPIWETYIDMPLNIKDALKTIIKQYSLKYDNIVIVSNRSYSHWFNTFGWNRTSSIQHSEEEFEKIWYNYIDINSENETIWKNNSVLQINPQNYQEIRSIFSSIKHNTIIDLQNKINALFLNDNSQYLKILVDEKNINHSILIFCITSLLNLWEYKSIKKVLINDTNKTQKELLEIIEVLKYKEDEVIIKEILIILWVKAKLLWIINLSKNIWISSELENEIENLKKQIEEINNNSKKNIDDIFNSSLDELVKKWEILARKLYYYRKKSGEELSYLKKQKRWDNNELSNNEIYKKENIKISNILNIKEQKSKYIFLANVWEGKSTELAKFAKYIIGNNKYIWLFYSSKSLSPSLNSKDLIKKIDSEIKLFSKFYLGKKIVLFFDWIDELKPEIKDEIKSYLINMNNKIKVIISSRKSEFNEFWNENYNSIGFENLDNSTRNLFLTNRLKSLGINQNEIKIKISVIKKFLDSSIITNELKNTPLILYFLCVLSVDNKLDKIKNRTTLYDEIVKKIIIDHNKTKWDKTSEEYIEYDIEKLSEIAYSIFKWNKINLSDSRYKKLSILFKKNLDNDYDFIHKSFYEYFLGKYLSIIPNWVNEIFNYKNKLLKNNEEQKWIDFKPIIIFFSESLENNQKIDELKELLWENWLLKNRDESLKEFYIWLEILHKIKKNITIAKEFRNIKRKYIQIIKEWSNKEKYKNILRFIKFQKDILFENNIYVTVYYKTAINQNPNNISDRYFWRLWNSKILKDLLIKFDRETDFEWKMHIVKSVLSTTWDKKTIEYIYNYGLSLINRGSIDRAKDLFSILAANKFDEHNTEYAYKWAIYLIKSWKLQWYKILSYLKLWTNNKSLETLLKWADLLWKNWNYKSAIDILLEIDSSWRKNISKKIYNYINKLSLTEPDTAFELIKKLLL